MCSGWLNPALKSSANHEILCRSYRILPNIMSSAKGLAFCRGFFFGRRSDPPFGRRFLFCRSAKIDLRLNTDFRYILTPSLFLASCGWRQCSTPLSFKGMIKCLSRELRTLRLRRRSRRDTDASKGNKNSRTV